MMFLDERDKTEMRDAVGDGVVMSRWRLPRGSKARFEPD
jgi:hypothetical protein